MSKKYILLNDLQTYWMRFCILRLFEKKEIDKEEASNMESGLLIYNLTDSAKFYTELAEIEIGHKFLDLAISYIEKNY